MGRGPVAWVIDLHASPEELHKQAEALERKTEAPERFLPIAAGLHVPPRKLRSSRVQPRAVPQQRKLDFTSTLKFTDVVSCPQLLIEVLSHTGISHVGRLATLRKDLYDFFRSDEAWHVMCFALASQSQLYAPNSYALGWKRLFWDQLWPARKKWFASDVIRSDFGIRVGVRFRPPTKDASTSRASDPKLFLPLHQRLRLCRAGKLDWQQLLEVEGGNAGLVEALSAQGELPAEVVEAILIAQQLKAQAAEARTQAAAAARSGTHQRQAEQEASNPDQQDGAADDEHEAGTSSTVELSGVPDVETSSKTAQDSENSTEKKANETTEEPSEDESRGRYGGNAHVLAVQPSRVMMYVPGQGARPFQYARVIDDAQPQAAVYAELGHDMICAMLNGFNACLFCYGQTGSGKTHTLFGPDGCFHDALLVEGQLPSSLGVLWKRNRHGSRNNCGTAVLGLTIVDGPCSWQEGVSL